MAAPVFSQVDPKVCEGCHDGKTALTPHLGGQPAFYVTAQLLLFREGRRENPVMSPMARGLSDADLSTLGERFSKLRPPGKPPGKIDQKKFSRGKSIAAQERCASCHGDDFAGDKNVPRIANQREDYLRKALTDYRRGARVGFGNAVMPETVAGLKSADLSALAHYLAFYAP